MKASRFTYKNTERIKVDFEFNAALVAKLKTLPDAKWSKEYKTWHIPYTKAAFDLLLKMFPDLEYTKTDSIKQEEVKTHIESSTHTILKRQFSWILPNYPGNLDLLKDHFKDRIQEVVVHEAIKFYSQEEIGRTIGEDELLIIQTEKGRLKLFFGYNKELTKAVKRIPYCNRHTHQKYWSIPY